MAASVFDNELNHFPYAYDAGHFHRVYVGEVFNNRYRVHRKLGFGCSATVWLAQDIATDGFVALKVLSAMASHEHADTDEQEILHHLRIADPAHPGWAHTLQLLDDFYHPGSEGLHRCFVFPVMGESLVTYAQKFPECRLPEHIAKSLSLQLLQALDYTHTQGVIHTDIKQENIMLKMADSALIKDLYLPRTAGCTDPQALENK